MKGKDIRDCEKVNGVWRVAANGHVTRINDKRNGAKFWSLFLSIFMWPLVCVVIASIIDKIILPMLIGGGVPMP